MRLVLTDSRKLKIDVKRRMFFSEHFIPTFIASLLGSTHCASMCGGFACFSCVSRGEVKRSSILGLSIYHLGRLASYLILVNLIFYIGLSLKSLNYISTFSGVLLLVVLISQLFMLLGISKYFSKLVHFKSISSYILSIYSRLLNIFLNNKSLTSNFLLGFFTTLIPCGWLYLNLSLASTAESIAYSNLIVLSFWLGTLPLLSILGLGSIKVSNLMGSSLKTMGYLIIILLSIYSLSRHFPEVTSRLGLDDVLCHLPLSGDLK